MLSLSVSLLFRFIALREQPIVLVDIQGYAAVALLLADSLLESYRGDIAYRANNLSSSAYGTERTREMEAEMLLTLDVDLDRPGAVSFFEAFTDEYTQHTQNCSRLRGAILEPHSKKMSLATAQLLRFLLSAEHIARWRGSQLAYAALRTAGLDTACMRDAERRYPLLYNAKIQVDIDSIPLVVPIKSEGVIKSLVEEIGAQI